MSRILRPLVIVPIGIILYFALFVVAFASKAQPDERISAGMSGLVWGLLAHLTNLARRS